MTRKRSHPESSASTGDLSRRSLRQRQGLQAYAFASVSLALFSALFPWMALRYGNLIERSIDGAQTTQGQYFIGAAILALGLIAYDFLQDKDGDRRALLFAHGLLGLLAWFFYDWTTGVPFDELLDSQEFTRIIESGRQRQPSELSAVLGLGFWGSAAGALNASAAIALLAWIPWLERKPE